MALCSHSGIASADPAAAAAVSSGGTSACTVRGDPGSNTEALLPTGSAAQDDWDPESTGVVHA